jgi:4-hydroxybenzoate polyprenyltransferase
MKRLFNFIFYSNFFISFCAAAASWQTYIVVGNLHRAEWVYIAFVFCSTFVFYNAQRLFLSENYKSENSSERHRWIFRNKKLLTALCVLFFLAALPLVNFWQLNSILIFSVFSLLASLYFLPVVNLRSVPLVKASYIALLWAFSTVVFPYYIKVQHETGFVSAILNNKHLLLLTAERFFFILPLCIVFNIRDMAIDRLAGVKTIPIIYGIRAAKIVSVLMVFVFAALVIFRCYFVGFVLKHGALSQPFVPALMVSAATTCFVIFMANKNRGEEYYLFVIDGMIALQAIFVCLV